MTKVLHVVGGMNLGGTETFIMNLIRNLNSKDYKFEFLTYYDEKESGYYDSEILKLGGKIHSIKPFNSRNLIPYIFDLKNILKNGDYDVIHAHTTLNTGFILFLGWVYQVPVRIAHSHNTGVMRSHSLLYKTYASSMKFLINTFANRYFACSEQAGKSMFYQKNLNQNYHFIPNAVELSTFLPHTSSGIRARSELGIPLDAKVIGHVGRYGKAKNHKFIVRLFEEISKQDKDTFLVLVGDGSSRKSIEQEIRMLGLFDRVKVLGNRSDVAQLMQSMDVFILPSFYEGFGIVLLEAQAAGIPCVVSENVQKEPDMGMGLINWVELADFNGWVDKVIHCLYHNKIEPDFILDSIRESQYNLPEVVKKLSFLYSNN